MAAGHDPQPEFRVIDAAERFIEAVKHGVRAVVREDRAFDPSQPRVPASEPDGGQWLGHNHRVTGSAKPKPPTRPKVTGTQTPAIAHTVSETDTSGQNPVASSLTGFDSQGNLLAQSFVMRDGTTIQSSYFPNGSGPYDSQFVVTNPDGSAFSFVNSGDLQTVYNATTGQLVSMSMLGPNGVTPIPLAQPPQGDTQPILAQYAPTPAPPQFALPIMVLTAAAALFGVFSSSRSPTAPSGTAPDQSQAPSVADPNGIPVFAISKTRDYTDSATGVPTNVYVGEQSLAQVQNSCKAYSRIQAWTDEAVNAISPAGMTPQAYGIAVHSYVEAQVKSNGDPTIDAEVSLPKLVDGIVTGGIIIPDIIERVGNGTVCVYDIKTGVSDLPTTRANDFANRVFDDKIY